MENEMSEAKFTKGDWSISKPEGSNGYIHINSGNFDFGDIATVSDCGGEGTANAQLIKASPKMYEMLESVSHELRMLIDEVNDQRASHINSQTETEPDYHDQQTLHEIQCLLAEARGEQ